MATFQFDAAKKIQGLIPSEDLSFAVQDNPTVTGGVITPEVVDDAVIDVTSAATVDTTFDIVVNDSDRKPGYSFEVVPDATAVCTVNESGQVGYLSNGTAKVYINSKSGRRLVAKAISRSGGQESRALNRYRSMAVDGLAEDTLAYHVSKTIDDRLAACLVNHPPNPAALHIWRQQYLGPYSQNHWDPNAPDAVRNADAWFADLDVTPISVAQSNGIKPNHPAQLIGPRHCLTILHDSYWASGKCVWLGTDGQYYSANIVQTYNIGVGPGEFDTRVCYLDAEIPAAVTKFKLMPANYGDYLPSIVLPSGYYGLNFNPACLPVLSKQAAAGDQIHVNEYAWITTESRRVWWSTSVVAPQRTYFASPIINGDSGSPHFIIVNDEPVLMGQATWTTSDYFPGLLLNEITTGMRATAQAAGDPAYATYAPLIADLSGFQSFA